MQVKAIRKLKRYGCVKNDSIDSWLVAETLRLGEVSETSLATDEVQSLKTLTRYHQALKQELATVKTQCICVLDSYFPEYAKHFSDVFGAASLTVLKKYPTPEELRRVRTSTLAKEMSEASHGRLKTSKATELKAAAKSSIGIKLGQDAACFQIKSMASQVEFLNKTISKVKGQVETLLIQIEPLIITIPGVSITTGAQIVAEIGDVYRFTNAPAIVKCVGLNSGVSQSRQFEAKGGTYHQKGFSLPQARLVACGEPKQTI